MTTDLTMLVYSALLTAGLAVPTVIALIMTRGVPYAAGNRDEVVTLPAWAERARRAHLNALENLPIFAALVLVAHAASLSNEATAFGATLFFWGRVGHAVTYIAGIPYLRTAAFAVSVGGMISIAVALLAH